MYNAGIENVNFRGFVQSRAVLQNYALSRSLTKSLLTQKISKPGADFVADAAEDFEARGVIADRFGRRVFEALMDAFGAAGKDWAGFLRVVADRDDVVEFLTGKFLRRF